MSQAGRRGNKRSSPATVGRAIASGVAVVIALVTTTGAVHAEEPATTVPPATDGPQDTVPVGEVDGAEVAVGQPPVPPADVVVAVGQPPVPPSEVDVAVGQPPVPSFSVPALW